MCVSLPITTYFLSRLFGGERKTVASKYELTFLSRLFGGEHGKYVRELWRDFLSRLFGGEP